MFNWFDSKEVRAFKGLCAEAYEHLKKKEFKQAVALSINIHHIFDDLPDSAKKKFEKQVGLLFRELILLVRINEAYRIAKNGSMAAFHREMERIHNLTFDIGQEEEQKRDIEPLLAFAKQNYAFFLDVYTYKKDAGHFRKHAREVKILVEAKETHKALKKYAELLLVYNQIAYLLPYHDRLEFYEIIKKLLRELSMQRLLAFAQERVGYRRFHTDLPVERAHMERPFLSQMYQEEDARFDEIHDLVERGELGKAFKVYERVTKEKLEHMKKEKIQVSSLRWHKQIEGFHQPVFNADKDNIEKEIAKGDLSKAKKMLKALK